MRSKTIRGITSRVLDHFSEAVQQGTCANMIGQPGATILNPRAPDRLRFQDQSFRHKEQTS